MVACWRGTRGWHQQQLSLGDIVGLKGPVGKPNSQNSPDGRTYSGQSCSLPNLDETFCLLVFHILGWGVVQVLPPVAFGALEFSSGPVYTRENRRVRRSLSPTP